MKLLLSLLMFMCCLSSLLFAQKHGGSSPTKKPSSDDSSASQVKIPDSVEFIRDVIRNDFEQGISQQSKIGNDPRIFAASSIFG